MFTTIEGKATKERQPMTNKKLPLAPRHTAEVKYTENYGQFGYLKGNRPVNARHVQELIASFEERPELIHLRPILVNEKMEIVDGQHSLVALQTLELPVPYVVTSGLTIGEAQLLNALQKPWIMEDYARSYATAGNPNYRVVVELIDEYAVPITAVMAYAAGATSSSSGKVYRSFKVGRYVVTDDVKEVRDRLNMLTDFKDLVVWWNSTAFARAFLRVTKTEGYDHDRMINGATKMGLARQGSQRDYLLEFERAYNYRKSSDIIRFVK